MTTPLTFLIIDGYPKEGRDELEGAGMTLAWKLYADMLLSHLPGAEYEVLLPSDFGVEMPDAKKISTYAGILWTGCSLSVTDTDNPSVRSQLELADTAYEIGTPGFGSCWGLQIAVVVAGGRVAPNPKGREMGIARRIMLTDEGQAHPMYDGKFPVFEAFISHDDMVVQMPPGAVSLSGNDWTEIQSAVVNHKNGTFWATQYHPEYDLNEMACLIVAREKKLIEYGFYSGHEDLISMVTQMKALSGEPDRKDLRWQLAIDDDVLDPQQRQREFINWIEKVVLPRSK